MRVALYMRENHVVHVDLCLANLSAFRKFVRFALVWFCLFPLLLCVWEGLRLVNVKLPGLFSYRLYFPVCPRHNDVWTRQVQIWRRSRDKSYSSNSVLGSRWQSRLSQESENSREKFVPLREILAPAGCKISRRMPVCANRYWMVVALSHVISSSVF